jgi:hypothetical protein
MGVMGQLERDSREPGRAAVPSLSRNHDIREPKQKHLGAYFGGVGITTFASQTEGCQIEVFPNGHVARQYPE